VVQEHANSHVIDLPYLNITVTREFLLFQLWCSYISHYACAAADTWASEVGILADGQPRLVTSLFLRSVPPGTNGGMSALGTAASVAGGLFIGLIFYVASFALPSSPQISQLPMVWLGGVCGVLGSFFDSILGATVQATYYSKDRKCIVKKSDPEFKTDLSICLISGMDVLTNEEVNFVSILLTMLCSFPIGSLLYCVSTKCIEY
ncbi:PGR, partial [Symbiodinium microadriaticum]